MEKIVTIDVSPFKKFIGKIIPMNNTELYLLAKYKEPKTSEMLKGYFSFLKDKEQHQEPKLNNLINMTTTLKRFISKNVPTVNSLLIGVEVIRMFKQDGMVMIEVKYIFE